MKLTCTLAFALLAAAAGLAQSPADATKLNGPVPAFGGVDLGLADLTPAAQAKLRQAGVGGFSLKLSPLQLTGPVPAEATPKGAISTAAVSYHSVVTRVRTGETVLMAVGVTPPAGYVFVSEEDARAYGVVRGLWKCFRGATGNLIERVGAAVAGDYRAKYHHPPDLRAHLLGELHGFSAAQLDGLSIAELERLHDAEHDKTAAAVRPVTGSYRSTYSLSTSSSSTTTQQCVGGNCPAPPAPGGGQPPAATGWVPGQLLRKVTGR